MSWISRVIARVSRHEGGYGAVNPNTDGAGLSWGILQWNQASRTLGPVVGEVYASDPLAFQRVFGASWAQVIQAATSGPGATAGGVPLWKEPWLTRFREAGRVPAVQAVQDRIARTGEYMRAAAAIARGLNVATERAMALFYDTVVQQGSGGGKSIAAATKDRLVSGATPQVVDYRTLLATFAQTAADRHRYRGTTPPAPRGRGHRWVQVQAGEWHDYLGATIDLYADVRKRRLGIVNDPQLRDLPVDLA